MALELTGLEVRAGDADAPAQLVGNAAVFEKPPVIADSWYGGLWEESVARGAFKKTIKEADVRALWNHDPNIVLGRNKAGTLKLSEDETGLLAEMTPPDNEWGRPILDAVRRGDVSGMSIAFQVVRDEWTQPDRAKEPKALRKRKMLELKLLDVSPVTYPAFPQTDIAARSDGEPGPEADESAEDATLRRAFGALRLAGLGLALEPAEREHVRAALAIMQRYASAEALRSADAPGDESAHASTSEPGGDTSGATLEHVAHSVDDLRCELELCEMRLKLGGDTPSTHGGEHD